MLTICAWGVLALVHFIPAVALVRPSLITTMYGVDPGSTTYLLLQHRAALFSIIVIASMWAIFRPETRQLATVAVGASVTSFLVLFVGARAPRSLRAIAFIDVVALPFLGIVAWNALAP